MAERRKSQRLLRNVFEDLNEMVTHYVRTQLVLAGLALMVYTFVFWLMRLPYSFALSSIAGILEFIPVVGPAGAAVVVLGVSFLAGYNHLVIVIIFLGCWRIVQDYVISPQLMRSNLEIHPLAVIFAVLVGAELGGVVGVYLSIPIVASLRIFWRTWQRYSEMRQETQPRAA
jgi:predicted PurR-regulated permease PerM